MQAARFHDAPTSLLAALKPSPPPADPPPPLVRGALGVPGMPLPGGGPFAERHAAPSQGVSPSFLSQHRALACMPEDRPT